MNMAHGVIGFERTTGSKGRIFSFFKGYWTALQERRKREKLRADLSCLNDFELNDTGIACGGIARGEIDYCRREPLYRRTWCPIG